MQRAAHKNKCAYQGRWRNSWLHLRGHRGFCCLKIREKKKKILMQVHEQQALQQAQRQRQQQLLLILQGSSGNLSFSSNTSLLREDKEMSRAAPSTFRAKEEGIKRKKMEICDCILSHLGQIKEETKRLATIHKLYSWRVFCYFVLGMNSKTAAKMTVVSINLLRNKRQAMVKQMRHGIVSGQDATTRVQVHLVLSL
ncbi:hypothetical protein EUGRSUZ_I00613 [Eucalyptus grandis]|uniref:Uncharacterized protein n=3 Tax=Eucalyptus grandis TaxID=71139 RepID=A0A059ALE0_EUCGR|nr:hypothetical protein EUGRSUZ_I00613 [Eucalyptus grandis]KAK3411862.1 hypothetical protein EUGRSUZ_I00613 [Eucalyptus grandis]